jgi:ankyrin repeat protein
MVKIINVLEDIRMKSRCFLTFLYLLVALSWVMGQDGAKLIEYIMYQEFDQAKELVKQGVDVNYQNESNGSTALMLSCQYNFIDMAKFLIDHGADLNLQTKNGQTALMAAAGSSEKLFNLLLEKGADIKQKADDGTTVFTRACIGVLSGTVPLSVVYTLLDKGVNVNEASTSGRAEGYTCLMMAARNKQPELVRLLVKNGADVNLKAKDGKSALSLAKAENDTEMVKLLTTLGAKE